MAATPEGKMWFSRRLQCYYHVSPLQGAVWMPTEWVPATQITSVDDMQAMSERVLQAVNGSSSVETKHSKMKDEREKYQAVASTRMTSASQDASPAVVRYNFVLDLIPTTAFFFYSG
jgi:hypothetical protein